MFDFTDKDAYVFVVGDHIDADHPHGDMDRLPITFLGDADPWSIKRQGLMPARAGAGTLPYTNIPCKSLLSGKDVCFLLEATAERLATCDTSYTPETFREYYVFHRVLGYDLGQIAYIFKYTIPWYLYLKAMPPNDPQYDVDANWASTWVEQNAVTGEDLDSDPADFSGDLVKLSSDKVMNLFNDLKKLTVTLEYYIGSISIGTPLSERHDRDDRYPMPSTVSRDGYQCRGGEDAGDGHPYAFGGWSMQLSDTKILLRYDHHPAYSFEPKIIEVWILESYGYTRREHGRTVSSSTHFQVVKLGTAEWNSGRPYIIDTAAAKRARLVSAMQRYFGITPGYSDDNENDLVIEVSQFLVTSMFVRQLGDHTKWWY